MTFLLIIIIKSVEAQKDISSAIGNAHHTAWSPPSLARINAAGSSTTSCLATDTTRLYTPFPSAWNTEPAMMQNHAIRKWNPMMRSAGTPMASISSDASNMPSSTPGIVSNTINPTRSSVNAYTRLHLIALITRLLFPAP